jgi:hypothetical protein
MAKRLFAISALLFVSTGLVACTGNAGSAGFVPRSQTQTRHLQDVGGGGPVAVRAVTDDAGAPGGPVGWHDGEGVGGIGLPGR